MKRLPDTGLTSGYTTTFGEDNDYTINAPYFIVNSDGTVIDTITGLMWQQNDGGEMSFEQAVAYCESLSLGSHLDWRLPSAHEAFSILNFQQANPALDPIVFGATDAEYWWSSTLQVNDTNKVWVTNAGGGIGNHPKTETISSGGTKKFHVRAVRNINPPTLINERYIDNGDGTITDIETQLIWQKNPYSDSLNWEQALEYADTLTTGNLINWRLPNIRELQSLNDESRFNPSLNTIFFNVTNQKKIWSSTTLPNHTSWAWYLNIQYGITTYASKTLRNYIWCVHSAEENTQGIEDFKEDCIQFYPNPFSNHLYYAAKKSNLYLVLSDILGQEIYVGTEIELQDFSNIPKGLYFVKNNHVVIKLIKQ